LHRDCACTFYLVFKEPANPAWLAAPRYFRRSRPSSPSALFPSGEPFNPTEPLPRRQLFSRQSTKFFLRRFRGRRTASKARCTVSGVLRADSATWELRAEGVSRLALSRFVGTAGLARSNQYTLRSRDCQHRQPPESTAQQETRNRLAGRTLKNRAKLRTGRSVQRREQQVYRWLT